MACSACKGMKWVYAADRNGEVIWEHGSYGKRPKTIKCQVCGPGIDSKARAVKLEAIDGLTRRERKRTFLDFAAHPDQQATVSIVSKAEKRGWGQVALRGDPGTGKTHIMHMAVNEARERGRTAVYTTMSDLLQYLRQAYAPDSQIDFDGRWKLLIEADLLAVDELDDFSSTPWATERFLRLIDERWRRSDTKVTLYALNGDLDALPAKVRSRLDGSESAYMEISGRDMRMAKNG